MTFDEYVALPKAERLKRARAGVVDLDSLGPEERARYEKLIEQGRKRINEREENE